MRLARRMSLGRAVYLFLCMTRARALYLARRISLGGTTYLARRMSLDRPVYPARRTSRSGVIYFARLMGYSGVYPHRMSCSVTPHPVRRMSRTNATSQAQT